MVFQNNVLSGAAGSGTTVHTIDQSIRFNSADSAYMYRTPNASNRRTWTVSCWFKLTNDGISSDFKVLFGAYDNSSRNNDTYFNIGLTEAGILYAGAWDTNWLVPNRTFRDHSAWYHIVFAFDTTNVVSTERVRMYINGNRETSFSQINAPTLNFEGGWNNNLEHSIGRTNYLVGSGPYYFDGYIAEIYHIDGQALDCNSFGEFNSSGIWIPKDASGLTFGTNGYYIDGRDSSDLGDDESGNGNDYTTGGLASHDQVSDSPTNNFATINSIYADNAPAGNAGTLSNGNLQYVGGGSTFSIKGFTYNLPKSGKWYFEYMIGGSLDGFGFVKQGEQGTINASNGPGQLSVAQGGGIQYTGWRNGGNNTTTFADSNTGSPFTTGFIHQVAIDVDNGKFYYGVKNTYYAADGGSDGNPSAGTNHMSTFAFSTTDVVLLAGNYSGTQYWNFGQDGTFAGQQTAQGNADANGVGNFYYAPPTGYLALCSKNVGS